MVFAKDINCSCSKNKILILFQSSKSMQIEIFDMQIMDICFFAKSYNFKVSVPV
jgi:hypothetical protein